MEWEKYKVAKSTIYFVNTFCFTVDPLSSRCSCNKSDNQARGDRPDNSRRLTALFSNCKPCSKVITLVKITLCLVYYQAEVKSDLDGPPCCPVPAGQVMEQTSVLTSLPGHTDRGYSL